METRIDPAIPNSRQMGTPAALSWRLLAIVYDCLPMIPILMLTSAAFLWLNGGRTVERAPLIAAAQALTTLMLIGAYFVVSWRRGGQTVGMRPWRLKVVAADGSQASWSALWMRFLVSCLTPVVGQLWSLIDRDRRALNDIASGTLFLRLEKTGAG